MDTRRSSSTPDGGRPRRGRGGAEALDGLDWIPARVRARQRRRSRAAGVDLDGRDLDADDWWFRTPFDAEPPAAGEELALRLDGLATVADVFLNGEPLLEQRVDVRRPRGRRRRPAAASATSLRSAAGRSRRCSPRAAAHGPRWRTRLVAHRNLRFFRTMLLGRAPGFAPGPAAGRPVAAGAARAAPRPRRRGAARCARASTATTASSR